MTGTCPRYGVKTFNVEAGQNITVQIARNTRRCVALFRVGCENLRNKTKYFRLRLDEVRSERPKKTLDLPGTDLRLT